MELMYGLKPVHRDNPQAGESEWYYYDPRGTDNFSDMKKIDVPSENSPNPYADEIQNYLYKNDRYNYNQLYGSTPPPATQPTQTSFTGTNGYTNENAQFSSRPYMPKPSMWQNIKDGAMIAADTIRYTPEALGELAADTKIAYDYWQKMNNTGKQLVNTYGSGQGADIDNYYHPLLQCELAKISPTSRNWGLRLGYAKEIWDYHQKKGNMPMSTISSDSQKDLQNNLYGSNLGYYNPNKSCEDLLDDRRTPNMRKANIR